MTAPDRNEEVIGFYFIFHCDLKFFENRKSPFYFSIKIFTWPPIWSPLGLSCPVHQHHSLPIQFIFSGRDQWRQVFADSYYTDCNRLIMMLTLILSNVSFYIPMYLSEQKYIFICCLYGYETWYVGRITGYGRLTTGCCGRHVGLRETR